MAFPGNRLEEAPRELQASPREFHGSGRPGKAGCRHQNTLCWHGQWKPPSSTAVLNRNTLSTGSVSSSTREKPPGLKISIDIGAAPASHLLVVLHPPVLIYSTHHQPSLPWGTEWGVWRAQRAPPDLQGCGGSSSQAQLQPLSGPGALTAPQLPSTAPHTDLCREWVWQLNQNQKKEK